MRVRLQEQPRPKIGDIVSYEGHGTYFVGRLVDPDRPAHVSMVLTNLYTGESSIIPEDDFECMADVLIQHEKIEIGMGV